MPEGAQDRAFADVQAELVHERARAIGRAGRTVERHLERCDELRGLVLRSGREGGDDDAARASASAQSRQTPVQRTALRPGVLSVIRKPPQMYIPPLTPMIWPVM